ncbi:MAG: hypothetical protein WCK89_23200 [bacterium]
MSVIRVAKFPNVLIALTIADAASEIDLIAKHPPIDNSTPVAALTVGQLKTLIAGVVRTHMHDYEAALIEVDEALWDAQFAASQDVLERLSEEALAEDDTAVPFLLPARRRCCRWE